MNDIERRFYSDPDTKNIPVRYRAEAKEIFQKILLDVKEENPDVTISELLSESTDKYDATEYGDVSEF